MSTILAPGSRKGAQAMETAAVKGRSLWDDARRRLFRNKAAVASMITTCTPTCVHTLGLRTLTRAPWVAAPGGSRAVSTRPG